MTLLLASAGFVAQYPAAARWFLLEQTEPLSHQGPSPWAGPSSTRTQGILWTSLVAAIMTALAAAGLAFVSMSGRGGGALFPEESAASSDSPETPVALETLQSLPIAESHFASTSIAYPDAEEAVKEMLSDTSVALSDFIGTPLRGLDQSIELVLPGSSFGRALASDGKKKVRQAVSRLARVTVYWPEEGDFYTRNRKSSTGVRLRDGHCAVDPAVIPYGSVVHVPSIGPLLAVDTGSAVISRRAAKSAARTSEQRKAIVIDVFCSTRAKAKALIKRIEHFAVVTWQPPRRSAGL